MGVEVNIRVELPIELAEHVSHLTGEEGAFDSVEAYVEELIRRDLAAIDDAVIESHAEKLKRAFAAPESESVPFDRDAFFERMRQRHGA